MSHESFQPPKAHTTHHFALGHHGNGRSLGRLGHLVLHDEEHVLIIQQPYQVEAAKTGRRSQRQIPNHHGAVEAPLEQKLSGRLHKIPFAIVLL